MDAESMRLETEQFVD